MEQKKLEKQYEFTDSLKRRVLVPDTVKKVIPIGIGTQIMLCTLCPEKMASVANIEKSDEETYRRAGMERITTLPKTGEMYSTHRKSINPSMIAKVDADIIVDVCFHKDGLKSDLDTIQATTKKSTFFTDASFGRLPQAYRELGKLLGCENRAELLASYLEKLYASIEEKRKKIERNTTILYAGSDMEFVKNNPIQNQVIAYLGGTPVDIQRDKKDSAALQKQDIDYIVFYSHDRFHRILRKQEPEYKQWSSIPAIQKGCYAVAPALYHSWIGNPLFSQMIGLPWLGYLIWPEAYDFDILGITREFYELFFGYKMTDDEIIKLLGYYRG